MILHRVVTQIGPVILLVAGISTNARAEVDVWPINKTDKIMDLSAGPLFPPLGVGIGVEVGVPIMDHFSINLDYSTSAQFTNSAGFTGHGPDLIIKAFAIRQLYVAYTIGFRFIEIGGGGGGSMVVTDDSTYTTEEKTKLIHGFGIGSKFYLAERFFIDVRWVTLLYELYVFDTTETERYVNSDQLVSKTTTKGGSSTNYIGFVLANVRLGFEF